MTDTPTPAATCPPWCTTDHATKGHTAFHRAATGQQIISPDGRPAVHVGAYLAAGNAPGDAPMISLAYSPVSGGGGVALLTTRNAPAIGGLLRALGHDTIADALDRAVDALTAPPEEI